MSYKKRAKSGWNTGKKYKKESNKSERQYSSVEEERLDETPKHKKKKKKLTEKERLIKQLNYKEKYIKKFDNYNLSDEFFIRFKNRVSQEIKNIKRKLQELDDNKRT